MRSLFFSITWPGSFGESVGRANANDHMMFQRSRVQTSLCMEKMKKKITDLILSLSSKSPLTAKILSSAFVKK
jgi:hypothetical protein